MDIPVSAPNPNSKPSVKRVEAFTYTVAESTSRSKRAAAASSPVTIASAKPEPWRPINSIASSSESTTLIARIRSRYSVSQSSGVAALRLGEERAGFPIAA